MKCMGVEGEPQPSYRVYVLNLGSVPAYLLDLPKVPDYLNYIDLINELRSQGIVAEPANEGLSVAGFVFNSRQIETLKAFGDLAVGLSSENSPSLLTYDEGKKNTTVILGCLPIVAAYRGRQNGDRAAAYKINPGVVDTAGYKGTSLERIEIASLDEFDYRNLTPYLPRELWEPIAGDGVKRIVQKQLLLGKLDISGFGREIETRVGKNQADLLHSLMLTFNTFEAGLEPLAHLGGRTSDSLLFYYQGRNYVPLMNSIKKAHEITRVPLKVALVRTSLPISLAIWKERIFHTTRPVTELEWAEMERLIKFVEKVEETNQTTIFMMGQLK